MANIQEKMVSVESKGSAQKAPSHVLSARVDDNTYYSVKQLALETSRQEHGRVTAQDILTRALTQYLEVSVAS